MVTAKKKTVKPSPKLRVCASCGGHGRLYTVATGNAACFRCRGGGLVERRSVRMYPQRPGLLYELSQLPRLLRVIWPAVVGAGLLWAAIAVAILAGGASA